MKVPKIRIKTAMWSEQDVEIWKKKYEKLAFVLLIFFITNELIGILTVYKLLIWINAIPTLMCIIIYVSYNKHKQNEDTSKCNKHQKQSKKPKTCRSAKQKE